MAPELLHQVVEGGLAQLCGAAEREVLRALLRRLHDLSPPHAASAARMADRDARLLAGLRAPLARRVVQPGLFDRRAIRDAAAAHGRSMDGIEELESRLAAGRATSALAAAEPALVAILMLT